MDELDCVVDVPTVRSSSSASSPDSPSDGVEGEAKGCGESYIDPTMFDEAAAKGKHARFRDLDRDAAAKASRSHAFVKIKVPEGGRGGQRMSVALKGGKVLKVTIPMGAKPGQLMSVKVREGDTMYSVWFSSGWPRNMYLTYEKSDNLHLAFELFSSSFA